MSYSFSVATVIDAPVAEVFDLSRDVDAHIASVPGSGEQAVGGVTSGLIGLGDSVTWRARHFGIWFRMTSRIEELDRPHRFVDAQVSGPFSRFWHEHVFEPVDGGTRMVDTVELTAPLGLAGRPVEQLLVGPYLQRLIRDRGLHLKAFAEQR